MRHVLAIATLTAALSLAPASSALAQTATMGNDPILREIVDTATNFTIVDTNNPAAFDGFITSVDFYAHQAGTVRFLLVDASDQVTWISDEVVAADAGLVIVDLGGPVSVSAGTNLGVYSKGTGVVSWEYDDTASSATYTPNNSGLPAVGDHLAYAGSSARVYSMRAELNDGVEEPPTGPTTTDDCRDGGWQEMGYRNQGQCAADVNASDRSRKA